MTGESSTAPSTHGAVTEVACPHCERPVDAPVPNRDVEPTVRSSIAAFGDHSVVHCPSGHRFWVYYC